MTKSQNKALFIIIAAVSVFLVAMFAMAIDALLEVDAQAGCTPGDVQKDFANYELNKLPPI